MLQNSLKVGNYYRNGFNIISKAKMHPKFHKGKRQAGSEAGWQIQSPSVNLDLVSLMTSEI